MSVYERSCGRLRLSWRREVFRISFLGTRLPSFRKEGLLYRMLGELMFIWLCLGIRRWGDQFISLLKVCIKTFRVLVVLAKLMDRRRLLKNLFLRIKKIRKWFWIFKIKLPIWRRIMNWFLKNLRSYLRRKNRLKDYFLKWLDMLMMLKLDKNK